MRVTLEFNLPEESEELKEALYGDEAFSLIKDIRGALRNYYKHGNDGTLEAADKVLSEVFAMLGETIGGIEV